ncbi:ROK family glucokinase [Virgibacillus dakarensis]|uniref:Glucokinase n=1 Tax=Lentibacillus populi TaxID=1827502 RepID=A0A9W5X459_9BACI|nr:ROK family glucokinase [Lentibacillus populi]MTW84060.1 ROK family glucokinase [Virgibacillus dakarensis]GGB29359.1 glucokinase [Lentibacillus populi]
MNKIIIGVDIGGTTSKIGLLDQQGIIQDKWEIPTIKANNGESIVTDIWDSITDKLKTVQFKQILGIGIGAPGFIDGATGLVYEAVNIGWKKNFQLAKLFSEITKLPVFVENDANIAVLGENWKGAGNHSENLIAITLGTGVGGGIIANGEILNGVNGTAGEIGHITVDPDGFSCNCGKKGCLETIASATGIVRQAKELAKQAPDSRLASLLQESGSITAKDVFSLAGQGDLLSKTVIERTGDVLGFAIANLATVINPSIILIGGGVSKAGDQLITIIKSAFHKYALPRVSDVCDIKVAQLGNDAGIIGAAYLVLQKSGIN